MTEEKGSEKQPHAGHRQRLKEQCLQHGLENVPSHQVLELLLFYAMPYKDTNELAHRLIDHFGSFSAVLNADYQELLAVDGVGPNTACMLALMPEFFRRYQVESFGKLVQIGDRRQLGEYCQGLMIGRTQEVMYLIFLNTQRQVLRAVCASEGTIGSVSIDPRDVVEQALRHRARYVALSHNHPGGGMAPSAADVELTHQIIFALEAIRVSVLDHIIVAKDSYYSFADHGLIRNGILPGAKL